MKENKKDNFFLKIITIKKEIPECVPNGGNLRNVEDNYGIRFSKPL